MNRKIKYIKQNVENLSVDERKEIMQMILNTNIDRQHIKDKGCGVQVSFDHISDATINAIEQYIKTKLAAKDKELSKLIES